VSAEQVVEHVTCLGCGCACDDIATVVRQNRIVEARNACLLGRAWFGDGAVPQEARVGGHAVSLEAALTQAATILTQARRPLVYLAAELSCETQRAAVGIADRLRAVLDSATSEIAGAVLAAQRRGWAAATLGELRQRADLVVFWGVDPAERYPRYTSRYAVAPGGLQAPSRTVVAVDVGGHRGPGDADARVIISADVEVDALGVMRAIARGHALPDVPALRPAVELASRMMQAQYVALVHDAEPDGPPADPPPDRAEGLIALALALNGPTRCALSTLRGGGNRSGADAVVTWQTGFPCAVDFGRGYPSYRPHDGAAALVARREIDATLVIGSPRSVPEPVARGLASVPTVAIGPHASAAAFEPAVAVDTGVAGIHEGGMAFRMDDVPLPLRPSVAGPPAAAVVVRDLATRLVSR
jgi:formylmethanofuran dehydrogenase subunit B